MTLVSLRAFSFLTKLEDLNNIQKMFLWGFRIGQTFIIYDAQCMQYSIFKCIAGRTLDLWKNSWNLRLFQFLFQYSKFLHISRDFRWESCETNVGGENSGSGFLQVFPVWRLWNRVDKRVHALHATVGECILQLRWTQCELWLMVEPTQRLALQWGGPKVNLVSAV